jgi:hypothetical protein
MGTPPEVTSPQQIWKIGILLGSLGKFNTSVLKFLVLQMNTLQQTFEYEFLPVDYEDTFLQKLSYQSSWFGHFQGGFGHSAQKLVIEIGRKVQQR